MAPWVAVALREVEDFELYLFARMELEALEVFAFERFEDALGHRIAALVALTSH